jgi:protein tyrosine/serine phosphatase
MNDRRAPSAETLAEVIEAFRRAERPFLIHCKSGADRAGLASAMYLMTVEGVPVAEARRMLSFRHLHVTGSRAGVLGGVLDAYEDAGAEAAMPFERWVSTSYDPEEVARRFAARRGRG